MLVLASTEIEYCQIIDEESTYPKHYPGALYRKFLFIRQGCYAHNQEKIAIARCRHFLDREKPIFSILVKEENQITLWSEFAKVDREELNLKRGDRTSNIKLLKNATRSTDNDNIILPPAIILLSLLIL